MTKAKVKQIDSYIFRKTDEGLKYLMLKRNSNKHYEHLWQGVAGKIEKGETAVQTVVRELEEETGLTPACLFVADHVASFYNAHKDQIFMVPVFGIEVDNDKVELSDEHCDFRWVSYEEASKLLTWKGQKEAIETVNDMIINADDRVKWAKLTLSRKEK